MAECVLPQEAEISEPNIESPSTSAKEAKEGHSPRSKLAVGRDGADRMWNSIKLMNFECVFASASKVRQLKHHVDIYCRAVPAVCDGSTKLNAGALPRSARFAPQVGPHLRLAYPRRFLGHVLGGFEGLPDENNTKASHSSHNHGGNEHPPSPFGHLLLGIKILLGPLLFTLGAHSLGYAFILGDSRKSEACGIYLGVSLLFIGLGACALVAFLPLLEPFVPPYQSHDQ